jgi:hypothetical protein
MTSAYRLALSMLAAFGVLGAGLAFAVAPVFASERYVQTGQFTGGGAPSGALSEPVGVAVESAGDVYVVSRGNRLVYKFDSEGHYIASLNDTFVAPTLVAVDNYSAGERKGNVYVVDVVSEKEQARQVIDEFNNEGRFVRTIGAKGSEGPVEPFGEIAGLAVGPSGELLVADRNTLYELNVVSGSWALTASGGLGGPSGELGIAVGLGVDSTDHLYVLHEHFGKGIVGRCGLSRSSGEITLTSCNFIGGLVGVNGGQGQQFFFTPFAVDPSTKDSFADVCVGYHVYTNCHIINDGLSGVAEELVEVGQFAYGLEYSDGIAVNANTSTVYATNSKKGNVVTYKALPAGPPTPVTGPARNVQETAATITGTVNPQALPTIYWFQYATSDTTSCPTHPEPSAETLTTCRSLLTTGAGEQGEPIPVSADLTNLVPGATYHYRIVAENKDGTVTSEDQTFTTQPYPPPTVATSETEGVTQTSAVLTGIIDPHGQQTHYQFEVGATTSYGTTIPSAIPGIEPEPVRLILANLVPGTTYHYRITATNHGGTTTSEDHPFTTTPPLFTPSPPGTQLPPPTEQPNTKPNPNPNPPPLTNTQKLAKALKACRKDKPKKHRANCEKNARKKYATPPKKTK